MNFLKVSTSAQNVLYNLRVFIPCKLFLFDLGEVNLHIVMSYMTSNISSSIVLESFVIGTRQTHFLYKVCKFYSLKQNRNLYLANEGGGYKSNLKAPQQF